MSSTQTSCSLESTQSEENSGDEDENDEMLDPRVKIELESLNSATTEINDVEQELEEMHAVFRQTLSESAFVLKTQANILGKCVKRSRPYYEKMEHAKKLQVETQKAALNYERACSQHQAAKQAVAHAEQKLVSTSSEHKTLDHTWQEMLNKAIKKVMDSELQKQESEREHLLTAQRLTKANKEISDMKIKLKSSISKSRVYYDLRDKYMEVLEEHKQKILSLQQRLKNSKQSYSRSLRKLESISDEIHELRKSQVDLTGPRQDGVGAECLETVHENSINTDNDKVPDGSEQEDDGDEYVVKIDIGDEDDRNTDSSDQNGSETDDIENDDSNPQLKTTLDDNVECTEHNDTCEYEAITNDTKKQDDVDDKAASITDQIVTEDNRNFDIENDDSALQRDTPISSDVECTVDIDKANMNDEVKDNNSYLLDCPEQKVFPEQNGIVDHNTAESSHHEEFNKEQIDINNKLKDKSEDNHEKEVKPDIIVLQDASTDCSEQHERLNTNNINQTEVERVETEQNTVDEVIDGVDSKVKLPECTKSIEITDKNDEITNSQNYAVQKTGINKDINNDDDVTTEDSIEEDNNNQNSVEQINEEKQNA